MRFYLSNVISCYKLFILSLQQLYERVLNYTSSRIIHNLLKTNIVYCVLVRKKHV